VALTFHFYVVSGSSLPLSSSIYDLLCTFLTSLHSFGLSKSPFQFSQFLLSEILAGKLMSLLAGGQRSIYCIWRTFNIRVCPLERSFADKAGGTGDFSSNVYAVAPSSWKSDQETLTISWVSEMYSTAVIL
jgi:hypothetical protein